MIDLQQNQYNVIVIGGGHAGCEAALAAARMGLATLLLTQNIETIGQLSCNPSIGGIGKSHLVKEIDALGGLMARAIDIAGIQFRILNSSKGPAVRATRAQADRVLYKQAVLNILQRQDNLKIMQQTVDRLLIKADKIYGVETSLGLKFNATTVVLTTGTFLNGKIFIGLESFSGGRAGDAASLVLAQQLRDLAFPVGRLKTGTPPRLAGNTIDYSKLKEQPGDLPTPVFSFLGLHDQHPKQVSCYTANTNENTHEIIKQGLDRSPLFSGIIEGVGPRYCPSIEDKVERFTDKNSHQIFLEPEGLGTNEVYPNGISTSLAYETQEQLVHSISGLENCHITRPGYAIEYDFFDPLELKYSLETKKIQGLFFAGQVNGTTGYEEAAAQGLVAGTNAALQILGKNPCCLCRYEAYIGVMIDDLINCGTKEPYRMFTSRAEYRLLLREDNADLRLTEIGYKLGLVDEMRWNSFVYKRNQIELEKQRLRSMLIRPENLNFNLSREFKAYDLLKRPEISYQKYSDVFDGGKHIVTEEVAEQVEIQIKYEGYIKRQEEEITRLRRNEVTKIPEGFDYENIKGFSIEVKQKLKQIRPTTVGQAARIPGITPAALSLLLIYLKKDKNGRN